MNEQCAWPSCTNPPVVEDGFCSDAHMKMWMDKWRDQRIDNEVASKS